MEIEDQGFSKAYVSLMHLSEVEVQTIAARALPPDHSQVRKSLRPLDALIEFVESQFIPRLKREAQAANEDALAIYETLKREYPTVLPATVLITCKYLIKEYDLAPSQDIETVVALSCVVLGISLKTIKQRNG